jgi:hypothetical protein
MIILLALCLPATASQLKPDQGAQPHRTDPAEVLRSAQTIFIRSKSVYFKPASLEQDLLNRDEVQDWGLVFTRQEADADLIIEVDRKRFTNAFVYSVMDPKTNRVLMGGKIGSLGGSVEGQIGDSFVKKMRKYCGRRSAEEKKPNKPG